MNRKTFLLGGVALLLIIATAGCARALVRVDGPYEGRVINSETREPIQGVVVLGVWYSVTPTVTGAMTDFYEAKETVTDGNGEFRIEGLGVRVMTNVMPVDILVFKAGYEYFWISPSERASDKGFKGWEDTRDPETHIVKRTYIYDETLRVKWEGDTPIIPLKKVTVEEGEGRTPYIAIPAEKAPLMEKECQKASKEWERFFMEQRREKTRKLRERFQGQKPPGVSGRSF